MSKTGRHLEVVFSVGPCIYWVDGLEPFSLTHGADAYISGPNGYHREMPWDGFSYLVIPATKLVLPAYGKYTLVVHTTDYPFPGCYEYECLLYEGWTKVAVTFVAPAPTQRPVVSPRPTLVPVATPTPTPIGTPTSGPTTAVLSETPSAPTPTVPPGQSTSDAFAAAPHLGSSPEAGAASPRTSLVLASGVAAIVLLVFFGLAWMMRRRGA